MRKKEYVFAALFGFLIGAFVIHPVTLVVREFFHWQNGHWHLRWYEISISLKNAYEIQQLPNSITYGVLTSLLGILWLKSIANYRLIAQQAERFAQIGIEASTIVHDINNPLFGIKVFSEMICEGLNDEEKLNYCKRIHSSAEKISSLIAEIKTLAYGNGKMFLHPRVLYLDELTKKVIDDLRPRILLTIDKSSHIPVFVDPLYFERVIMNIIKNDLDVLRGRDNGFIKISASEEKKSTVIKIEDNGPGIPLKIKKHLFEFGVTYGKVHGSGLGLYASKRIVLSHGGSITFKDRPGGGTVFVITLPPRPLASESEPL